MRKAIAASILGLTALGGTSPDVPPSVLSRLPTYCRYDVDIRDTENPYRLLAKVTKEDDVTCPYNAGSSDAAQVYRLRGDSPCAAGDFPGIALLAVREIDGRTARRAMECAPTDARHPLATAANKAYLLQYKDAGGALLGILNANETSHRIARNGGPFIAIDVVSMDNDIYMCFTMLPGAKIDPSTYLRLAGMPFPASAKQEELAGQSCREALKARYPSDLGVDAVSTEFSLWLLPSPSTPSSAAFVDAVRSTFAKVGAEARTKNAPVFLPDRQLAGHTSDGTGFAVIGGTRQAMFQLRRMTAGTCAMVYAVAADAQLHIETDQTDLMDLRVPGVEGRPRHSRYKAVDVTDAADLCNVLRRGFDEWRANAAEKPIDMSDLDGHNYKLVD